MLSDGGGRYCQCHKMSQLWVVLLAVLLAVLSQFQGPFAINSLHRGTIELWHQNAMLLESLVEITPQRERIA